MIWPATVWLDTLKSADTYHPVMEILVTVAGVGEQTVELDGGTYGDIIEAVGLTTEEATVLVDGRPVPDDQAVTQSAVTVLRLIHGG